MREESGKLSSSEKPSKNVNATRKVHQECAAQEREGHARGDREQSELRPRSTYSDPYGLLARREPPQQELEAALESRLESIIRDPEGNRQLLARCVQGFAAAAQPSAAR